MVLHAFLIAGATLSVAAVFAVAIAVLLIADRAGTPYLASGRFLLDPIATRWMRHRNPDLTAGYALHGYTRWSEIAGLRERGWTPERLDKVPANIAIGAAIFGGRKIVDSMTGDAFAVFPFAPRMLGLLSKGGVYDAVIPVADMQDWFDLLGLDAPFGPQAGLSLDEARAMAAAGTLDGPTVRAMAALRA